MDHERKFTCIRSAVVASQWPPSGLHSGLPVASPVASHVLQYFCMFVINKNTYVEYMFLFFELDGALPVVQSLFWADVPREKPCN